MTSMISWRVYSQADLPHPGLISSLVFTPFRCRGGFMNRHGLFSYVLALLGFAPNLFAQGVGASGDIKGIIKDSSGAVMPNVAVAIVENDKGIRHRVATDSAGQYRMTELAPASYEVSAAIPGFESQLRKNVVLNLGETVIVDFQMKVSGGKEIVEVLAGSPVVDTARGSQAGVLEQQSIRELPIDRRDYLTFALLMPGVSNSNTIADNADFRVKQKIGRASCRERVCV